MVRELLTSLALRLWIVLAVAAPLALAMAALFGQAVGTRGQILLALATVFFCFGVVNWGLNQAARFWIKRRGKEAVVWGQARMDSQARDAFESAMAVLDGWLPSLGARRRLGLGLGGRFASFILARPHSTLQDMKRIEGYLRACPADEQVVSSWLRWCANNGNWRYFDSGVFAIISRNYQNNPQVQAALARVFLAGKCLDFTAMATYNKLLQTGAKTSPGLIMELAAWLRGQQGWDDTSLAAFITAVENGAAIDDFGPAITACLMHNAAGDPELVRSAQSLLGTVPDEKRRRWQAEIPRAVVDGRKAPGPVSKPSRAVEQARGLSGSAPARRLLGVLPGDRLAAWIVAATVMVTLGGFTVLAPFFLADNSPSRELETEKAPVEVTRRFTIQVAAYIHEKDARSYVDRLRKKGRDAFCTRAGKGQKTWFQVKIGRFGDRAEARRFGNSLKNEGIIDDFYVSNYKLKQGPEDGPLTGEDDKIP